VADFDYQLCENCGHVDSEHGGETQGCNVAACSCPAFKAFAGERMTCPDRRGKPPGWDVGNQDYWSTNRWGPYYGATWPAGFPQPRVCSFCGGVHPDDAITLVAAGWESESTGKNYKRYLEPPGYHAWLSTAFKSVGVPRELEPMPVSPLPPVKLYVWHFNDEQTGRFNQVLDARRVPTEATDGDRVGHHGDDHSAQRA